MNAPARAGRPFLRFLNTILNPLGGARCVGSRPFAACRLRVGAAGMGLVGVEDADEVEPGGGGGLIGFDAVLRML